MNTSPSRMAKYLVLYCNDTRLCVKRNQLLI
uniref:Uncharacterized protein n=1 Tax=Anguilla anguilla TaxID=7936 RepID=A0A0E9V5A2_ANGAN